eukprot:5777116-Pleurochrysis_carterae.AAC.1
MRDTRVRLVAQTDPVSCVTPREVRACGVGEEEGCVRCVHVLLKQVKYCVTKPLRDVRRGVGSKAQSALGHEEKGVSAGVRVLGGGTKYFRFSDEHYTQLPPLLGRESELVEIVGGVVAKDIERLPKCNCCRFEHCKVSHSVRKCRFSLARPFGLCSGVGLLLFVRTRQVFGDEPSNERGALGCREVFREVVGFAGRIDRPGRKARAVEEGLAVASALCGTSPPVGLEFARGSTLAITRRISLRTELYPGGSEVRCGMSTGQGVVEWHSARRVSLESEIPYDPTRPGVEILLADGKRRRAYSRLVGRVSDGDQIPQSGRQPGFELGDGRWGEEIKG